MGKNFKILLALSGLFFFFANIPETIAGLEGTDTINIEMKNFIRPQYDTQTKRLTYILYGEYAKTEGAVIRVKNARIDFLGTDGKTVTATLTTPELFYNQTTQYITGNKSLHYASVGFDADGVGFDANRISELLHVRKDVKLVIKSFDETGRGIDFGVNLVTDTQRNDDSEKIENSGVVDTPG